MNLSSRLTMILNAIPPQTAVADIGTDHGQIPWALWERGVNKPIIATDISRPSLEKSMNQGSLRAITEGPTHRVGDGLVPLAWGEVDVVVMAGMGGLLMMSILDRDLAKTKSFSRLLLQPMNAVDALRSYLVDHGFGIMKEDLAYDEGRYYELIVATPNPNDYALTMKGQWGSLIPDDHPLREEFIQHKLDSLTSIEKKMGVAETDKAKQRLKAIDLEKKAWEALQCKSKMS